MISVESKKNCCGCSACMSVCPQKCITMNLDEEGFLYPAVDTASCIDCGQCEQVCPVINVLPEVPKEQQAYLVQHKDEKVLEESTSGGAFTAIAEYVIDNGGVVFGAAYDKDFQVIHTYTETKEGLAQFRNSKYVQSRIGESYLQVKGFLQRGRQVCFSGTPCQVEGLYHYLQKEYDNLILVDIVCHAIPSPLVWNKYLTVQQVIANKVDMVKFRDKYPYGYQYSQMSIYQDGKQVYKNGVDSDVMMRAFFSNLCDRPICYACAFKKRYRVSDFTLWDCFDPESFGCRWDPDKGVSNVLLQSSKAKKVWGGVLDRNYLAVMQINADQQAASSNEMCHSIPQNSRRVDFFADLQKMEPEKCFDKYFPQTLRVKAERSLRRLLVRFPVYRTVKRLVRRLRRRTR